MKKKKKKKKKKKLPSASRMRDSCPTLSFVTIDELNAVPKYLRGRLNLGRLNEAVAELSALLKRKYDFLAKNPRKMGKKNFEQVRSSLGRRRGMESRGGGEGKTGKEGRKEGRKLFKKILY